MKEVKTNISNKLVIAKRNLAAGFTVAVALAFLGAALSLAGYVHLSVVANEALAGLIAASAVWKLLANVR